MTHKLTLSIVVTILIAAIGACWTLTSYLSDISTRLGKVEAAVEANQKTSESMERDIRELRADLRKFCNMEPVENE